VVARNPDEPYFLGSVVLVKDPNVPQAEVIERQQRLPLTILLAVLRELSDNEKDYWNKLTWDSGDPIQYLASRSQIRLRRRDEDFFRKHVHDRGGLAALKQERRRPTTPTNGSRRPSKHCAGSWTRRARTNVP
jgi:hypothetical protein